MRIVFITCDDVFYLPRFFGRVLGTWAPEAAAMVILPPLRDFKTTVRRSYDLYGPGGFVRNSARYALRKLGGRLGRWLPSCRQLSVEGVALAHGIPVLRPPSVNAADFVAHLRDEVRPDLVVSVAASQIFREPLLAVPKLGCVNIHGALLPRYRGMLPSFWTLFNGEREGGVTVHYMSAGIDDGRIIEQRRFPIHADDTVETLIGRSKALGAELLSDVLARIKHGTVTTYPNEVAEGTYYSFPTRKDVRHLKARGRAVA
ncbi:MAG TPA: formyltransferase family protein [Methylomirabilota bacterium]|jgi:methionyl-tRNA formyltransferase|nr:formyltransferase family protein [Methylomirabilota bacterium]